MILANEIGEYVSKIGVLETKTKALAGQVKAFEMAEKDAEKEDLVRMIEKKGFLRVEWDSEKYVEIDERHYGFDVYDPNDDTELERIQLCYSDAGTEVWKDRDTEEEKRVYRVQDMYFCK